MVLILSYNFLIRELKYFQNQMANNQMFKVVLKLQQLTVRLRQSEADIYIKKKKQVVPLCPRSKVVNGIANINITTELYLDSEDSSFHIQVILYLGNDRKFGGQAFLNVFEWQANVYHHTVSQLNNSADPHAHLVFDFYYFKDNNVLDQRSIFLSQERLNTQYRQIERINHNLMHQKQELEKEVQDWKSKNEALEHSRSQMAAEMNQLQFSHRQLLEKGHYSISQVSQECQMQKSMKQELLRLIQGQEIDQNQPIKSQ